jgi:hypothetical protein
LLHKYRSFVFDGLNHKGAKAKKGNMVTEELLRLSEPKVPVQAWIKTVLWIYKSQSNKSTALLQCSSWIPGLGFFNLLGDTERIKNN